MNPEALEAFKKFVQRKGFSLEDVFTPEQTGEGPALWHPPGSPLRPLHAPGPSLHPLLPLPGPSVGRHQHCDGSQGAPGGPTLGLRDPRPGCGR